MNRRPPPLPRTHGGKRENSGRKPDWLRQRCAALIDKKKLLLYLARVAAGEETEEKIVVVKDDQFSSHVERVKVPCETRDRLHAFELLADRGYGKPTMQIQLDATDNFAEMLAEARQRANGSPAV